MPKILVVTPVKNSIDTTLEAAKGIAASDLEIRHKIFNDFSSQESKQALEKNKSVIGYDLVHLEEIIQTPSPNYKLVLQLAQKEALELNIPMLIVESDVIIEQDTIKKLSEFIQSVPKVGLVGAITVDEKGEVNFPYLKFKGIKQPIVKTKRSLSFCCTLFSVELLKSFDFQELDETKDWYDTFISKKSLDLGFDNYVLMNVPVLHKPHGSRPWKQLKYKNPIKYYFLKYWKGLDKI